MMPMYDYRCDTCGHCFEFQQKMSDEHLKICPRCGGSVRRLISGGTGFIVHGGNAEACQAPGTTSCDRSTPCCGLASPCADGSCDR